MEPFRFMLAEGKPNSLGRTLEVVETVLADPSRCEELFACWTCDDEWARMRAANGMRRVFKERPDWFHAYVDRMLTQIAPLDQASARWTLSQLWLEHRQRLTAEQRVAATDYLITTLVDHDDWIVLNMTMKTLRTFVKHDASIVPRIEMRVRMLSEDRRKSVANGAQKLLKAMDLSPL
ncbi:MAG: hypothetical protein AAF940_01645 [Pseudomonadota bacterium]